MKWMILALAIGVVVWMLISAEMTYIRADKQKKEMKEERGKK